MRRLLIPFFSLFLSISALGCSGDSSGPAVVEFDVGEFDIWFDMRDDYSRPEEARGTLFVYLVSDPGVPLQVFNSNHRPNGTTTGDPLKDVIQPIVPGDLRQVGGEYRLTLRHKGGAFRYEAAIGRAGEGYYCEGGVVVRIAQNREWSVPCGFGRYIGKLPR